ATKIEKRRERALGIWNEARDPRGTVVEKYLALRRLDLPAELAGNVMERQCPAWSHSSATFAPTSRAGYIEHFFGQMAQSSTVACLVAPAVRQSNSMPMKK